MQYKTTNVALLLLCGIWSATSIAAPVTQTVTFDGAAHGEIINNQYVSSNGLIISATNPNKSHDLAIIFNTNETGTSDTDLEYGSGWSKGNIKDAVLGNILIIAENNSGAGDGIVDDPDDQGDNASNDPSGTLIFEFDSNIDLFGFDLIDVEKNFETKSAVAFYNNANQELLRLTFADLAALDNTVKFSDNSANRIMPIDLSSYSISKAVIEAGGSMGIDNITWKTNSTPPNVVPEPGTLVLLAAGLLGLGVSVRRKRKL